MSEQDDTTKPKRKGRRAAPAPDPTPRDLIRGAHELKRHLDWLVGSLDRARAAGMTDEQAWQSLQIGERTPTRALPKLPSVMLAVRAVAERTIVDGDRERRGDDLGRAALRYVRGEANEDATIKAATEIRGTCPEGTMYDLRAAIAGKKSESAKWLAVYTCLAEGAYVWPPPDTRRGLRGELKKLYEGLSKPLKHTLTHDEAMRRIEAAQRRATEIRKVSRTR